MGTGLDHRDEELMDGSLGRVAGVAAFALMLMRLGRLLDSGTEAPAWEMIMIAAAFLGGVIWWLLSQTVSSRRVVIAVFVVAGLALFLRISVSHTLASRPERPWAPWGASSARPSTWFATGWRQCSRPQAWLPLSPC
jgi:hypothetical protein